MPRLCVPNPGTSHNKIRIYRNDNSASSSTSDHQILRNKLQCFRTLFGESDDEIFNGFTDKDLLHMSRRLFPSISKENEQKCASKTLLKSNVDRKITTFSKAIQTDSPMSLPAPHIRRSSRKSVVTPRLRTWKMENIASRKQPKRLEDVRKLPCSKTAERMICRELLKRFYDIYHLQSLFHIGVPVSSTKPLTLSKVLNSNVIDAKPNIGAVKYDDSSIHSAVGSKIENDESTSLVKNVAAASLNKKNISSKTRRTHETSNHFTNTVSEPSCQSNADVIRSQLDIEASKINLNSRAPPNEKNVEVDQYQPYFVSLDLKNCSDITSTERKTISKSRKSVLNEDSLQIVNDSNTNSVSELSFDNNVAPKNSKLEKKGSKNTTITKEPIVRKLRKKRRLETVLNGLTHKQSSELVESGQSEDIGSDACKKSSDNSNSIVNRNDIETHGNLPNSSEVIIEKSEVLPPNFSEKCNDQSENQSPNISIEKPKSIDNNVSPQETSSIVCDDSEIYTKPTNADCSEHFENVNIDKVDLFKDHCESISPDDKMKTIPANKMNRQSPSPIASDSAFSDTLHSPLPLDAPEKSTVKPLEIESNIDRMDYLQKLEDFKMSPKVAISPPNSFIQQKLSDFNRHNQESPSEGDHVQLTDDYDQKNSLSVDVISKTASSSVSSDSDYSSDNSVVHQPRVKHVSRSPSKVIGRTLFGSVPRVRLSALPDSIKERIHVQKFLNDEVLPRKRRRTSAIKSDIFTYETDYLKNDTPKTSEPPTKKLSKATPENSVKSIARNSINKSDSPYSRIQDVIDTYGFTEEIRDRLSKYLIIKQKRILRCMRCITCTKVEECRKCIFCKDNPRFGGAGLKKQVCVYRKCLVQLVTNTKYFTSNIFTKHWEDPDLINVIKEGLQDLLNWPDPPESRVMPKMNRVVRPKYDLKPHQKLAKKVVKLASRSRRQKMVKSYVKAKNRKLRHCHALSKSETGHHRKASLLPIAEDISEKCILVDAKELTYNNDLTVEVTETTVLKPKRFQPEGLYLSDEKCLRSNSKAARSMCVFEDFSNSNHGPMWQNEAENSEKEPSPLDFSISFSYNRRFLHTHGLPVIGTQPLPVSALCYICGSTGLDPMLHCAVCCEPFHIYCIDSRYRPDDISSLDWICRRCFYCAVCGHGSNLLECSQCQEHYHAECLGPAIPHRSAFTSSWKCPRCAKCYSCGGIVHEGTSVPLQLDSSKVVCQTPCDKLIKAGQYCLICYKACFSVSTAMSSKLEVVQCERCKYYVHISCGNISEEEAYIFVHKRSHLEGGFACKTCDSSSKWKRYFKQYLKIKFKGLLMPLVASKCARPLMVVQEDYERPCDGLKFISLKVMSNGYISIADFNNDMALLAKEYAKVSSLDEDDINSEETIVNFRLNYFKLIRSAFPWFDPQSSTLWSRSQESQVGEHSYFFCNSMSLPKNDDHVYSKLKSTRREVSACSEDRRANELPGHYSIATDDRSCILCCTDGDQPESIQGRLLYAGQDDWIHVNCAIWSAEVFEHDNGCLANVFTAINRGLRLKCTSCGYIGATVGCCEEKCLNNYHFLCAVKLKCCFLTNKTCYCHEHKAVALSFANDTDVEVVCDFSALRRVQIDLNNVRIMKKYTMTTPEELVISIGSLSVNGLGNLSSISDSSSVLCPVNFKSRRLFWNIKEPQKKCLYYFNIKERNAYLSGIRNFYSRGMTISYNNRLPPGVFQSFTTDKLPSAETPKRRRHASQNGVEDECLYVIVNESGLLCPILKSDQSLALLHKYAKKTKQIHSEVALSGSSPQTFIPVGTLHSITESAAAYLNSHRNVQEFERINRLISRQDVPIKVFQCPRCCLYYGFLSTDSLSSKHFQLCSGSTSLINHFRKNSNSLHPLSEFIVHISQLLASSIVEGILKATKIISPYIGPSLSNESPDEADSVLLRMFLANKFHSHTSKPRFGHQFDFKIKGGNVTLKGSSLTDIWHQMVDELSEQRYNLQLPHISYVDFNPYAFIGVLPDAVTFFTEQLPGAKNCVKYQFKHHAQYSEEIRINPSGCARSETYTVKQKFDMFSWITSRHRKLPPESNSEDFDERSTANSDLPIAIRYRYLKSNHISCCSAFKSNIHGRGLFALRNIASGELIVEYAGEVIRSSLCDVREKQYETKGIGCYMFRIDEHEVIDATTKGNASRFINHSCDPNCHSKVVVIDATKHILIFATRAIRCGDELTYDYKFPKEDRSNKLLCNCGSSLCRRYMN